MSLLSPQTIARSTEAVVLGAMNALVVLSPIACAVLSGRARYLRRYRHTVAQSARCVQALGRARVIARNLERKLEQSRPPVEAIEGDCTHCGRCCIDRSCVFLEWDDQGASRCSVYGNWFWRMTSCGSYPVDAQSIAVYECPSFRAIPIRVQVTGH
jgi:hypothetical protein